MDDDSCVMKYIEIVPVANSADRTEDRDLEPPEKVKCFQGVNRHQLQNTAFPFVLYKTSADKETSNIDNCEQLIDVSAIVSHSYVEESEYVNVKEENDDVECMCSNVVDSNEVVVKTEDNNVESRNVLDNSVTKEGGGILSSLLTSNLCYTGSQMFRGTNELLNIQQINDTAHKCNVDVYQRQGRTYASSNTMHSNEIDTEDVDIKEEEDDVCDAGCEMFNGAEVEQINNTECLCNSNTCKQMHRHSTPRETNIADISREYEVCHHRLECHSKLAEHNDIHVGSKRFTCDICNKKFTRSSDVTRHKRIHSGEKPFTCEVCKQAFTSIGSLMYHKSIHDNIKRFICDICEKAFRSLAYLTRHNRIHSADKGHACEVCKQAFTSTRSLKDHKTVHANIKRYICDICKEAFRGLGNLTYHKRIHGAVKSFACDVCERAFTSVSRLNYHKAVHI